MQVVKYTILYDKRLVCIYIIKDAKVKKKLYNV